MAPIVGVDLGTAFITLCQLRGDQTVEVRRALPGGAVVEGVIYEPDAVREVLEAAWSEGAFGSSEVALAVGGSRVFVRNVEMAVPEGSFVDALRWEAEMRIPYSVDDIYLAGALLSQSTETLAVQLTASKREAVDAQVAVFRDAGIVAAHAEPDALSLKRALTSVTAAEGTVVVLDLGEGSTTIVILVEGEIQMTRSLSLGGREQTDAVVRWLGVTEAEATALKTAEPLEAAVRKALDSVTPMFVDEIQRTLDFYLATQDGPAHITHILLAGGMRETPGLAEAIAARNPGAYLDDLNAMTGGAGSCVALGLALLSRAEGSPANLLAEPEEPPGFERPEPPVEEEVLLDEEPGAWEGPVVLPAPSLSAVVLVRILSGLLGAGLPLRQCDAEMMASVEDAELRSAWAEVAAEIRAGAKLSDALYAKALPFFDIHTTTVIALGEVADRLDEALSRVASRLAMQRRMSHLTGDVLDSPWFAARYCCGDLCDLVSLGLPVVSAVEIAADHAPHPAWKALLRRAHTTLLMGGSLYQGLSASEAICPTPILALVRTGELLGHLPEKLAAARVLCDRIVKDISGA